MQRAGSTLPVRLQRSPAKRPRSAQVREWFGGRTCNSLKRIETGKRGPAVGRPRFGIGSVAGRFARSRNRRCVSSVYDGREHNCRTLDPLVVGSIPTGPTNTFKGSVRKCWALDISMWRKTLARGRDALSQPPRSVSARGSVPARPPHRRAPSRVTSATSRIVPTPWASRHSLQRTLARARACKRSRHFQNPPSAATATIDCKALHRGVTRSRSIPGLSYASLRI